MPKRKFKELDVVELIEDLPEFGLRLGEQGVVVEAFDSPHEAYDLEFVDESGMSSRFAYSVKPEQIMQGFPPIYYGEFIESASISIGNRVPDPVSTNDWDRDAGRLKELIERIESVAA